MSPRPGQDPNDPQFQESLRRWKQQNNLPTTAGRGGSSREYGAYLNLPPGSRVTRDFVDRDRDGVDDRYQSGPGQPRGGSATPRAAESTSVPANVQTAWNTFNNPPPRTGGLKPTREMAAQFQQYGLTSQPAPQTQPTSSQTAIGGTLPDGSVKGDRNQDGRFGLNDFALPRVNSPEAAPAPAPSPSFSSQVRDARAGMYSSGKKRKRNRQIDAASLRQAMSPQNANVTPTI